MKWPHSSPLEFVYLFDRFLLSDRLRLFRYFVGGVMVSTGYTITVVLLVEWFGWHSSSLASGASFLIWTPISYIVHREFTFRFVGALFWPSIRFLATVILRLGASVGVVEVATAAIGAHYIFGVFTNWIVLPLISYFVLRSWVFRTTPAAKCETH